MFVEQCLNCEQTADSVIGKGHGNWESLVGGNRGPLGFQHTFAVSLVCLPWEDGLASSTCECGMAECVGNLQLCGVLMGNLPYFLALGGSICPCTSASELLGPITRSISFPWNKNAVT